jgi:hypothetical protein
VPGDDQAIEALRDRIRDLCQGIMLCELPGRCAVGLAPSLGVPSRVRIALDPMEFDTLIPARRIDHCPVCGLVTTGADRLPASLHPEYSNGFNFLQPVWVHHSCFELCTETDEPRGIPW